MVLGNVLGSNIFNVLGVLGIASIIYPLSVKTNTTWLEIPLSLLAAVSVIIIANDIYLDNSSANYISRTDGLILLLFFSIFLVYNLKIAQSSSNDDGIETKNYTYLKSIIFIILGLSGLTIGGRLIVTAAVNIAQSFGLSERIVGLTIVSTGTSLPELATSIVAVRKKHVDIAIGNEVGSNIFIGAFFSEVGIKLLGLLSKWDPHIERIQQELVVDGDTVEQKFARVCRCLRNHDFSIEWKKPDWETLKAFLVAKKDYLLRLLENPNLLEHESFTYLLWAVFHMAEEFETRRDFDCLPNEDHEHLHDDAKRVYGQLALQWLKYMEHLIESYPYLFSLSMRTNPFDPSATPIVRKS